MSSKEDFLAVFLGNPEQARILRTLILNEGERFSARDLGKKTGMSPESARRELEALKVKKVTRSIRSAPPVGKKKSEAETLWALNESLEHLPALTRFVRDIAPVHYDTIVDALKRTGKLSAVVLSGSFMGDKSRPADILVAADSLNEARLETAVRQLEPVFGREIRYAAFSTPEFRYRLTVQDKLLRDTLDFPHLVLLDRSGML